MDRRLAIANTVRFNFRAIEGLSIFESSSARSCASSAGVLVGQRGAGLGSFCFHLQPELDHATAGAESIAQRKTTAPPSYGIGSLMQLHFRYISQTLTNL